MDCTLCKLVLIIVATVTLHNYIKQEAQKVWLFEKYSNKEMIIIDSVDEEDNQEMGSKFMLIHIDSKKDSF